MLEENYNIPFFVLRTPKLPISFINSILNHDSDLSNIWKSLDNNFLEAIYLASPTLYREVDKINNYNLILENEKHDKMTISLVKYLNRASNIFTPSGLFSSCTIGKIDSTINLTVERTSTIIQLRLNMDILCRISREIVNRKGI